MQRANSLHDLKLFTQGADRNVSEVACQLNITTAAVSAAIKRLGCKSIQAHNL